MRKLIFITSLFFTAFGYSQAVTVDEFCLSNSFPENGQYNGRNLYGPIAGIYIFWDDTEQWTIGSLDKEFLYYTSADNSTGPGCSSTFSWTAPFGSVCESVVVSGTSCSTILPVEYLSFSAKAYEGDHLLQWSTAMEVDNDGFDVQRSVDGKNFETIGWVNGHGTTAFSHEYEFVDRSPIFVHDHIYYRLVQYDYNGQYEVSRVVDLSQDRIQSDKVTATFDNGQLWLTLNTAQNSTTLSLFNNAGQLIFTEKRDLSIGRNWIDIEHLPSGNYFLQMKSEVKAPKILKVSRL